MQIQLKNIKVFESLSEETTCFSATGYIDGVRCFTAENRGEGGSTNYHPYDYENPKHKELIRKAEAWAKEQPAIFYDMSKYNAESFSLPCSLEHIIDDLLTQHLEAKLAEKEQKRIDRDSRKWTMFRTPEQGEHEFHYYPRAYSEKMAEFVMERHPDATLIVPSWAKK